jgi:hypothetical protein
MQTYFLKLQLISYSIQWYANKTPLNETRKLQVQEFQVLPTPLVKWIAACVPDIILKETLLPALCHHKTISPNTAFAFLSLEKLGKGVFKSFPLQNRIKGKQKQKRMPTAQPSMYLHHLTHQCSPLYSAASCLSLYLHMTVPP